MGDSFQPAARGKKQPIVYLSRSECFSACHRLHRPLSFSTLFTLSPVEHTGMKCKSVPQTVYDPVPGGTE
ncbi:hypothetical protein BaRGS_00011866, partial [Batillaria attramentaria]